MYEIDVAIFLLIACGIMSIPAGLLSLATMLPPIRRFGTLNWVNRGCLVVLFALGTSLVLYATISYGLELLQIALVQMPDEPDRGAVSTELWLRFVVPPPLKQDCYSSQKEICKKADYVALNAPRVSGDTDPIDLNTLSDQEYQAIQVSQDLSHRKLSWKDYLTFPGLLLIPSLFGASIGVVTITTLSQNAEKSRDEGKKL